jgi:SAM-dependent methyltransferase
MAQDIYGRALLDFLERKHQGSITTFSSLAGKDEMPLPYMFRNFKEMPAIEQVALNTAQGKILDIGAGAGSHSLHLQKTHPNTLALDISRGAIEVCKKRGVVHTLHKNIWDLKNKKFDTLLALMNGAGICGKLENLGPFLSHLKNLLNENGQLLIDSSDILYMFEDEKGAHWIHSKQAYYGEVEFQMQYGDQTTDKFDWLYVDFNTLKRCALFQGLDCELLHEGIHDDYLAKITILKTVKNQ